MISLSFHLMFQTLTNFKKQVVLLLPHTFGLKFFLAMFVLLFLEGRPFFLKEKLEAK